MILLLIPLLSVQVHAEAVSNGDTVKYYFDPIVVTATKIAGAQRDLAASITTIDATSLQFSAPVAVLNIVNTHVPGLYLTEWGVMGFGVAGSSAGKISIRGLGGGADTHVLILRNGRPDFMGLMGCTIADEFVPDGVEKIEVIRGPASFLYGTNATAGVINIVSKEIDSGFKTQFTGGIGSYTSQKYILNHGGKLGDLKYALSAARRKTGGHRTDANSNYQGDHFTAHLGYDLKANTKIDMNGTFADMYLYDPGPINTPKQDNFYDIMRWGGDLTLAHTGPFGSSYVKLHGNFGIHKFFDGWYSHDRTLGIVSYHNASLRAGNTITLGFDFKRYGGDAKNTIAGDEYGEHYITEYAPYVHTQQLLGRFIVSAGLRAERHELFGVELLPKVGLVAHLGSATSLRLSMAKGFRSPSIRELYFFPIHNPDLRPDEIWNYEAGATYHLGQRMKLEVVVFRSEGDNMIINARNDNPPPFYQLTNSGEFSNTGYEMMINWLPVDWLEAGASWSQLRMENPIPNAPANKLTAYLTSRVQRLMLSGYLLSVADLISKDAAVPLPNIYRMKDYTVLDLSAHCAVYGPLALQVVVKNVFNAHYQVMYGYPMPGRVIDANLIITF